MFIIVHIQAVLPPSKVVHLFVWSIDLDGYVRLHALLSTNYQPDRWLLTIATNYSNSYHFLKGNPDLIKHTTVACSNGGGGGGGDGVDSGDEDDDEGDDVGVACISDVVPAFGVDDGDGHDIDEDIDEETMNENQKN